MKNCVNIYETNTMFYNVYEIEFKDAIKDLGFPDDAYCVANDVTSYHLCYFIDKEEEQKGIISCFYLGYKYELNDIIFEYVVVDKQVYNTD